MDNRSDDPWGGNGYFSNILRAVRMQNASAYATEGQYELDPAYDYASSAQTELIIGESVEGVVRRHLHSNSKPLQSVAVFLCGQKLTG